MEAAGHMSLEICREVSTGDIDSGNISLNWYLS